MQIAHEVGAVVERKWREENYREDSFPEIAMAALSEAELAKRLDPWDIVRWVHNAETLPTQQDVDGRFGDPPITLFSGSRFYIDVYFWLDGTTSIHQHAFSGAFQVLLGSSIHSLYGFKEERVINEHFSMGQLTLKEVQLLKQNDIRPIMRGRDFIHSLFHLDRPSATITIRTKHTPSASLQYDYRKPFIAIDPFFKDADTTKRIQTVSLLLSMNHPQAEKMISELVCQSDFHTAYYVLAETFRHLIGNPMDELFKMSTGRDRFNAILGAARTRHGELVDLLLPVLEEEERKAQLVSRRTTLTSDEHRFFLALLLNVPDRAKILELVGQRFSERDPVDTVLDWIDELANTRVLGSRQSNSLGIEGFGPAHLLTLEYFLRGVPLEVAFQDPEQVAEIKNIGSSVAAISELAGVLAGSPVLKPLCT